MVILGWHGGQRWHDAPEIRAPRAGRYEHGCGIYLTNVWGRASEYAKGGKSVMRVTMEAERPAPRPVPHDEVLEFIKTCPGLRNHTRIADYVREHRRERFHPEYLNNLCINEQSLTAVSAPLVARWLTEHGMPLGISRIGTKNGVTEEWMVVFDPSIIVRAEVVPAAVLDRLPNYSDREFPTFSEQFAAAPEPDPEPGGPRL